MSEAGAIGHNSVAGEELKSLVRRISAVMDEVQGLKGDISDIFAEAKGRGFDVRALKAAVKRSREDEEKKRKREELEEATTLYLHALGLI